MSQKQNKKCISIGHRGAMGYELENTSASFKKALSLQVDMIEFDIHSCASGELIIHHDPNLFHTTGIDAQIAQLPFSELQKFTYKNGEKILTLNHLIEIFLTPLPLNIEIKSIHRLDTLIETIDSLLQKGLWTQDHFLFSSFNHPLLKTLKVAKPQWKIGALIACEPLSIASLLGGLEVTSINVCVDFCSPKMIHEAHELGLQIFVYTANRPEDIKKLKSWEVDGIFSNYPDRVWVN